VQTQLTPESQPSWQTDPRAAALRAAENTESLLPLVGLLDPPPDQPDPLAPLLALLESISAALARIEASQAATIRRLTALESATSSPPPDDETPPPSWD